MGANAVTRLLTWLHGEEVGRDQFGNRYYRAKKGWQVHKDSLRRERRWVVYNGEAEASRVPPEWHGWLHHTTDEVPPAEGIKKRIWMKEHRPNATGTSAAYRPPGHTLKGGARKVAGGDYEPWRPE